MKGRALFFLVSTNLLNGASYLWTAWALKGLEDYSAVFFRAWIGAMLFLPFTIRAFRTLRLSAGQWFRVAMVGFVGYGAPLLLGTVGQKISSSANASLMIGIEPVAIVALSAIFLRETINRQKIVALICGLIGVTFIVLQGIPFYNVAITPHFRGDVILFVHALCWAMYSVLGKPLLKHLDPLSLAALSISFSLIPISLFGLPAVAAESLAGVPAIAWMGVACVAVGATFLGTITWCLALRAVPASRLANFIFLQPLVGVILGVFVEGELFTYWSFVGGVLILLAIFVTSLEPRNKRDEALRGAS